MVYNLPGQIEDQRQHGSGHETSGVPETGWGQDEGKVVMQQKKYT